MKSDALSCLLHYYIPFPYLKPKLTCSFVLFPQPSGLLHSPRHQSDLFTYVNATFKFQAEK